MLYIYLASDKYQGTRYNRVIVFANLDTPPERIFENLSMFFEIAL